MAINFQKNIQPAKKSYFFSEKSYLDVWRTILKAWSLNIDSIKKHAGLFLIAGDEEFTKMLALRFFHALSIIAVVIFGSIITAIVSILNIVVVVIFMGIIYIGFSIIWCVDRIYLMKNKVFSACPECKNSTLIPTYICSSCGVRHTNLTPNVYGIWRRTCECGAKLGTTFFNGRKLLESECPACNREMNSRESRPICIPVVGGRSVGKTAFITAFSENFVNEVAPRIGISTEFYDKSKEAIFNEIEQDYSTGSTRMTARSGNLNETSSISFSFFAQHPNFKPERLIHVYDIAGEVFTDSSENEVQKQYEYCHGIVFVVDPFAIPEVRHNFESKLSPQDLAGIGKADINEIINSFLNKLREVTGLSDNKVATVPLAIIISKIDSGGLDQILGNDAINEFMMNTGETNFYTAQDKLCRQFLLDNEMGSFLNNISILFKNNKFFAGSAIGHTRENGKYQPKGVLEPMQWLFSQSDPQMAQLWNNYDFKKK